MAAAPEQRGVRPPVDLREQPAPEPTLGELLSATTQDLSALMKSELELAKVELKEEASAAAKAAGMLGAAGVFGHLALLLGAFAAAWGLAVVMPTGFAFLIVAVIVAVVAAVLYSAGRARMRDVTPVAPETAHTLKEDAEWARQLRS